MKIHPLIDRAYKVLDGEMLTRDEAIALAEQIHGEDLLDLLSLANKVKNKFAGDFPSCSIINAKSGRCSQNCRYCAQSSAHHADIECYGLMEPEDVVENARQVYASGVRIYGFVTSGYGYTEVTPEFRKILHIFDRLHEEFPDMKLCATIGILSRETARLLAEHHVWRYNMNLQTNPARYHELVATTHSIEDKIQTIRYLQEFGVTNCTGGIFGLGETWEDRIDMALAVRDLHVEGSPLNILMPIPGTKLEDRPFVEPAEAAKIFAIYRLLNPSLMMKFACGRETIMKDFQGLLMLSGISSLMTGGYLTTRGRTVEEDRKFLEHLRGFQE